MPILAAQKGLLTPTSDLVTEEISRFIKNILTKDPIATNVTIVETLFPYLKPDLDSIAIDGRPIGNRTARYDPSTNTITIDIGELLPNQVTNITFDTVINLDLPVDVTHDSTNKVFNRSSIPSSISYLWLNNTNISDGLPENKIYIRNSNLVMQNPKSSSIEIGILSMFALILVIFYKKYRKN